MTDEKGPDTKVICVPLNDPTWGMVSDIHDVPAGLRDEIEHFFQVYKDLEHEGKVTTRGFGNRSEAERAISGGRERQAAAIARGRDALVAITEPASTSTNPIPIASVNRSLRTATPRRAATAGLT